jgi:hypothetical protein
MTSKALTPEAFDGLCQEYEQLQTKAEAAQTEADSQRALIEAEITAHGFVPDTAQSSRRFAGIEFSGTLTGSTGVEVDDASAGELEILLSKAKLHGIFAKLFTRRTEYSLVKGAENVLKTVKLPKRYAERIQTLYSYCFKVKTKKARLTVERVADIRAREEKAAKKAAKKGGTK